MWPYLSSVFGCDFWVYIAKHHFSQLCFNVSVVFRCLVFGPCFVLISSQVELDCFSWPSDRLSEGKLFLIFLAVFDLCRYLLGHQWAYRGQFNELELHDMFFQIHYIFYVCIVEALWMISTTTKLSLRSTMQTESFAFLAGKKLGITVDYKYSVKLLVEGGKKR